MRAVNELQGLDNDFWGMAGEMAGAKIHRDYKRGILLKRAMTARYIRHHRPKGLRLHRGWGSNGPSSSAPRFASEVSKTNLPGVKPIKRIQKRAETDLRFRPAASWTFSGNTEGFGTFRCSGWYDEHDDFWTAVWVDSDLNRYAREAEIIVGRSEGKELVWRMGAHGTAEDVPAVYSAASTAASKKAAKAAAAKEAKDAAFNLKMAKKMKKTAPALPDTPYAKYDKYATHFGSLNKSTKFKTHLTPTGTMKTVKITGTGKTLTVPEVAKFSKKHNTFVWWHAPNKKWPMGTWVRQGSKGNPVKAMTPWPNTKTGVY
jgi:hypothetical protein